MKFHAPTGRMVINIEALKGATINLLWAMKKIREQAGLPLDRYQHEPQKLGPADYAQMAIIEAAETIGIDLGVPRMRYFELDLRELG